MCIMPVSITYFCLVQLKLGVCLKTHVFCESWPYALLFKQAIYMFKSVLQILRIRLINLSNNLLHI